MLFIKIDCLKPIHLFDRQIFVNAVSEKRGLGRIRCRQNVNSLRALKVTGKKGELVAQAFAAVEFNIPISKTAEEIEGEIANEYKNKLYVDGKPLPDSFVLKTGWKNEEEGISFWPMVTNFYIIKYLMLDTVGHADDLNDYKQSKAYSYFINGWLGEILYHSLGSSPHCFVKTDCRPSQRINDAKHNLWILITKKEGKVLQGHCTCMAGLGATCNHVAAALFRLEAAMRYGLSNPACTSKPCEWLPN